ncbi:MAG TPA: menaquinone biosynthesis protein [Chloroflexota bacterium]|jgi:chorismate dehydratase|nr:menaquinone biosynthesis protein [Chloroflexota bacterium]
MATYHGAEATALAPGDRRQTQPLLHDPAREGDAVLGRQSSVLSPRQRPRVGHIQFLNCLPLYYGLVHHDAVLDMELTRGTPTELNRLLLRGELDVAPISSIEYLRHADELVLLPDLTVSADGAVKSIALVSRVPAAELHGRRVALTTTSATSQVLTEIVLGERYHVTPQYFPCPPQLDEMLARAEAALLIGDPALVALWQPPPGLRCYDLGEEWYALTGQAMVYAVWAVRREYAAREPELVAAVLESFRRSLRYSVAQVHQIAADAARWESLPAEVLENYFRTLRFEFGPRYQAGLLEFARRAAAHGALQTVPALEFFTPTPSH